MFLINFFWEKTEKSKLLELEKQTGSIRNAINEYINLNF